MTIYYTASDIDQLFASGVSRIELGPDVKITDYARELARELGIELVLPGAVSAHRSQTAVSSSSGSRYNKPRGCQH